MAEISLVRLAKALNLLTSVYQSDLSEIERDGAILRFKYTLELCWKSSKKILLANGIETDTPKNVMRELGQLGWISDPASWLDYIEKRNMTSHMYNEEVANEIFKIIGQFIKDANLLLSVLGSKNK